MEQKTIYGRFILEILGTPKEYIEQTMRDYVAKIKKEGIQIKKEKYEEAQKQEKLFTTFTELEIEFKNLQKLLSFCFEALPSSVEILQPLDLEISAPHLTDFLNDLQAKLHEADMIVKNVQAQNKILDTNTLAVLNNFIVYILREEPKTIEELSEKTGITTKDLKPFLKRLQDNNKIKLDNTKYTT